MEGDEQMKRYLSLMILSSLFIMFLSGCHSDDQKQDNKEEFLPTLVIHSETEVTDSDKYITCNITLYINEIKQFTNLLAGIRLRGNSTQNFDKKPYRIRFDQEIQLLDLGNGASKSWVLLAEYADLSMLRNKITFDLAKGLLRHSFVSDTAFVEVSLNDQNLGVYLLAEQTHVNKHRVNIDESGVYDSSIFDTGYLIELEIDADRRNTEGEYMTDWFDIPGYSINPNNIGWWNAHEYNTSKEASFYVIKSDAKSLAQVQYIQSYMLSVYNAIYNQNSQETITELINIESAVDMYLLQLITNDMDNNFSSVFMYKDKGDKLVFGPPWDFDLSYGNHYLNQATNTINMHHLLFDLGLTTWFQSLVIERWHSISQENDLLETMITSIDSNTTLYHKYFEDNYQKWLGTRQNSGWHIIYIQEGLNTQIDGANHLKQWLLERIEFIQNMISEWQENIN
jgi:hypothetical protein